MINRNDLKYLKRPQNFLLFAKVFSLLIVLPVLVKLLKLPTLLRLLEHGKTKRKGDNRDGIEMITKFANFIIYDIFHSANPCLLRSLLLFKFFRESGMDLQIAFGVKEGEEDFKGHAWLIHRKKPFNEKSDPSGEFDVIYVYPQPGRTRQADPSFERTPILESSRKRGCLYNE